MRAAVGPELQVVHSELEGLEWAAEEEECTSYQVVMVVAVPQGAPCTQQAGMEERLALASDLGLALGWVRVPVQPQILDVALGQEHLTQAVV